MQGLFATGRLISIPLAFTARIMEKFGFDPKVKAKSGLPFQVVLGYTGHNNGIIRGVVKNPVEMEKFLIKVMEHYEKSKNSSIKSTQNKQKEHK